MKYFFVLGGNPTLSLAELSAVFGLDNNSDTKCPTRLAEANGEAQIGHLASMINNIFVLEIDEQFNPQKLIKKIGGTIKIGKINTTINNKVGVIHKLPLLLTETKKMLKPGSGKYKFGISYYGKTKINTRELGMEIKKFLKEKNISCRWVTSREKTLSSVVVEQNKLINKGIEIVLINSAPDSPPLIRGKARGGVLIGQTLAVQPFKELSFRDYHRPARDDLSGMLPPKLAQIMINLSFAKHDDTILDPFCGSGTILTEAMLMGYKNLIGTDVSKKAINDTKKNIAWILEKFKVQSIKYKLHNAGASELTKIIKLNSIDAIITEPYLGPQRGKIDLKKTIQELEKLYTKSLAEFKKILKPEGRIVIIFPVFYKTQTINPNLAGFKIINPIPEHLLKQANLTKRNTIIYGRVGQKVWREIVVLQ